MMIGGYPYLLNPSGMGGVYAAAVASQPVQPVPAIPGQTNSAFVQLGGSLSGSQTAVAGSTGQPTSSASYAPGATLDIRV
jgi:hypothetical protein